MTQVLTKNDIIFNVDTYCEGVRDKWIETEHTMGSANPEAKVADIERIKQFFNYGLGRKGEIHSTHCPARHTDRETKSGEFIAGEWPEYVNGCEPAIIESWNRAVDFHLKGYRVGDVIEDASAAWKQFCQGMHWTGRRETIRTDRFGERDGFWKVVERESIAEIEGMANGDSGAAILSPDGVRLQGKPEIADAETCRIYGIKVPQEKLSQMEQPMVVFLMCHDREWRYLPLLEGEGKVTEEIPTAASDHGTPLPFEMEPAEHTGDSPRSDNSRAELACPLPFQDITEGSVPVCSAPVRVQAAARRRSRREEREAQRRDYEARLAQEAIEAEQEARSEMKKKIFAAVGATAVTLVMIHFFGLLGPAAFGLLAGGLLKG